MQVTPVLETITLFSDRFAACKAFYRTALELRLVFEDDVSAVFELGGILVNVLALADAEELVTPHAARGNQGGVGSLYTLLVADCDQYCRRLGERGVTLLNGPVDRPWGRRTAAFADPSGHVWEVAQKL